MEPESHLGMVIGDVEEHKTSTEVVGGDVGDSQDGKAAEDQVGDGVVAGHGRDGLGGVGRFRQVAGLAYVGILCALEGRSELSSMSSKLL